jgi:hypothetical protein
MWRRELARRARKNVDACGACERLIAKAAPDARHMAVDGLHSIDFRADRMGRFLLTLKIEGVKTRSFFGSF